SRSGQDSASSYSDQHVMRKLAALVALGSIAVGCTAESPPIVELNTSPPRSGSRIHHLVVAVQENHTFDAYFGRYCKAEPGSAPSCNRGPDCCEAGPATDPTGARPVVLDDFANGSFDPDHNYECMVSEINGGKMDRFVHGPCAEPRTFAYASPTAV